MSLKESNIEDLKSKNPNHAHIFKNTWKLYDDEPNEDEFKFMVETISSQNAIVNDKRTCIINGFGSQPKFLYNSFKTMPGVSVLWDGTILPIWAYPLSFISASHTGIVQIIDSSKFIEIFTQLSERAMVEFFSFSSDFLPEVIAYVNANKRKSHLGHIIGDDPSYFSFGVDGDYQGKTMFYTWSSFGKQSPIQFPTTLEKT